MKYKLESFTVNWQKGVDTNNVKNYINNYTFVSSIYTFFLVGNIIVFTPSQGTNREKYFEKLTRKENCQFWRSGGK